MIAAARTATGFSEDIWVTAWNADQMSDVQLHVPDAEILWTASSGPFSGSIPDFLDTYETLGVTGLSLSYVYFDLARQFSPVFLADLIDRAHARDLLLFGWDVFGVIQEPEIQVALDLGLDGLIVDDVGTLAAALPEPAPGWLALAALGAALGLVLRAR